jgi:3-dehydroquinate synthase
MSMVRQQRIVVPFEYPVYFAEDAFATSSRWLGELCGPATSRARALVVVDDGLAHAWPRLTEQIIAFAHANERLIDLVAEPRVVRAGEACKNDPFAVHELQRCFYERRLDRHALVILVGGGALLDMAGYAAATTHRGIRVVRVPTTVLAQADSGVGVKCGVNAFGTKNFLGAFAPPFAVVNDARFLTTLSARDRVAGAAEAVKVALVRDAAFFAWIEANARAVAGGDLQALSTLVRKSAELHLAHIATGGDPFERGSARPLDFGHWSAHKLESLSQHDLRHGEAVAIGMALDAHQSVAAGLLSPDAFARIVGVLESLGLPLWHSALALRSDGRRSVTDGIEEFREHLGGELCITLLSDIGRGVEVHELREQWVEQAIAWAEARACASAKICI